MLHIVKDTIYTKLTLMAWLDDKLGHAPSGLVIIGKILSKFLDFLWFLNIGPIAQLVERSPHELGVVSSIPHQGNIFFSFFSFD